MFGLKAKAQVSELNEVTSMLEELRKDYKYTPDIRTMEQKLNWNLFIYNQFMQDRRSHQDLIEPGDVHFRGTAFSEGNTFVMYKRDLGELSFPIVMRNRYETKKLQYNPKPTILNPIGSRIKGEIWNVPTERYLELDRFMENTVSFKRIRINVVIPFLAKKDGLTVAEDYRIKRCWMYVGVPEYWDALLTFDTTKLVKVFSRPKNREYSELVLGDYYYYSALEEEIK